MDCKKYDKKFYDEPDEIADKENRLLIKILGKLNLIKKQCLDFGCGTGHWISVFNQLQTECVGIDVSEKAINECSEKYFGTRFVLLTGAKIPFPDYYFDFILSAWVFQEITEEDDFLLVLNELCRVLKKAGKILIVDNEYPDKRFLCQSGKYGDMFLNNGLPGKLRFFRNSTVIDIMEKFNLRISSRNFIGNSFFEIYEK